MKAIQYSKHGGPEVLELRDLPDPEAGTGEVVVAIEAAAINHMDIHFRRGMDSLPTRLPHVPGCDGAGVVISVGPGVTTVHLGDRVVLFCCVGCGRCDRCVDGEPLLCHAFHLLGRDTDGTYAERMVVPAANVFPIPPDVGCDVAAAASLVYTTAWSMARKAALRPGQTVLVTSAGAGMGTALIQIAKLHGTRVIATAGSAAKSARARELGADEVIDHSAEEIDRAARALTSKRGVDVVFDHVGGDQWQRLLRSLRHGGTLVTCGATAGYHPTESLEHIFYRQLRILGSTLGRPSEFLEVMRLVYARRLEPVIDSRLPLAEAAGAHRRIEDRQTFGKVVLLPAGSPLT